MIRDIFAMTALLEYFAYHFKFTFVGQSEYHDSLDPS